MSGQVNLYDATRRVIEQFARRPDQLKRDVAQLAAARAVIDSQQREIATAATTPPARRVSMPFASTGRLRRSPRVPPP